MSFKINIDSIPFSIRERINSELRIEIGKNRKRYLFPYDIIKDDIILPFNWTVMNISHSIWKSNKKFHPMKIKFNGKLRDEQKIVKKDALKILNKQCSVILSMPCGFGKTITSINIATTIQKQTLVIVNKIVLLKQWEQSIKDFCPNAVIDTIKTKKEWNTKADFLLVNAQNMVKINPTMLSEIGVVIVDELHMVLAETLFRALQCIQPRYLIGLSATAYRNDEMEKLIGWYFGTKKIEKKLHREHMVYKVNTGFKPVIEKNTMGTVNWGKVLDSQSQCEERNTLIVDIVNKFKNRNFLILVKRIHQGEYLLSKLGEEATSLLGTQQEYNKNARILIGTCQKVGTGFDHKKLDSLIIASDLKDYFIQYLGRIFRTKKGIPLVFDLVDDYSVLKKHWRERKKIYIEHGGSVLTYKKENISYSP